MIKILIGIIYLLSIYSPFILFAENNAETVIVLFSDFRFSGVSEEEMNDYINHLGRHTQEAFNSNNLVEDESFQVEVVIRDDSETINPNQDEVISLIGGYLERRGDAYRITILYEDTSPYLHAATLAYTYRDSEELFSLCPEAAADLAARIGEKYGQRIPDPVSFSSLNTSWIWGFDLGASLSLSSFIGSSDIPEGLYSAIGVAFDLEADVLWFWFWGTDVKKYVNTNDHMIGIDSYIPLFGEFFFPVGLSTVINCNPDNFAAYIGFNIGLIHIPPCYIEFPIDPELYIGFDFLKSSFLWNIESGDYFINLQWASLTIGYYFW